MPTLMGKLVMNEDGKLCLKTTLGPGNPDLFDVPLEELLEEQIGNDVHVEIWPMEGRWNKGED